MLLIKSKTGLISIARISKVDMKRRVAAIANAAETHLAALPVGATAKNLS